MSEATKTAPRQPANNGKQPIAHPVETDGSQWAAENRKAASRLTASERETLLKRGLRGF